MPEISGAVQYVSPGRGHVATLHRRFHLLLSTWNGRWRDHRFWKCENWWNAERIRRRNEHFDIAKFFLTKFLILRNFIHILNEIFRLFLRIKSFEREGEKYLYGSLKFCFSWRKIWSHLKAHRKFFLSTTVISAYRSQKKCSEFRWFQIWRHFLRKTFFDRVWPYIYQICWGLMKNHCLTKFDED